MSKKFKDKMYNYEAMAPQGVWEAIAAELDKGDEKVRIMEPRKNNRTLTYSLLAAAAVIVIVFCVIFFKNNGSSSSKSDVAKNDTVKGQQLAENDSLKNQTHHVRITVPVEEKKEKDVAINKPSPTDNDNDKDVAISEPKHYITVTSPDGQPVKVSSKVASLIEPSGENDPSKTKWNKKVKEWKDIMNSNSLNASPGAFLDIVELSNSLDEK